MSQSIWIEVDAPITDELVHDFRNFGEDVFRALRDTCCVSINEIDWCESSFGVWDVPAGRMEEARETIERLLRRYGFQDSGRLTVLEGRGPYFDADA